MSPEANTTKPSRLRSGWIDAVCLALIVVVHRGMSEEIGDIRESAVYAHGFTTLALNELTEGFRAEILERCAVAVAVLLALGLALALLRRPLHRLWRNAPRGLPRPASSALRWGAAIALALPLSAELAAAWNRMALGRPAWNVVVIVMDTVRVDHLGMYGYEAGTSPHLDALARESFVFERAISNSSWTRPAVASLLTSLTPFEHGIYSESRRHRLAEDIPTLQRVLRDRGYRTAAFLANGHYKAGLTVDFDTAWVEHAPAEKVYAEVSGFLETFGGERFFLLVHNNDPHDSYSHREGFSTRPKSSKLRKSSRLLSPVRYDDPQPVITRLSAEDLAELKDNYDGEIRYLDHHIGSFLDELARRGLLEETIVVVTADHGEEFYDHGSWWHGGSLHNELIHVPLILRVPEMGAGRLDAWVSGIDLLPTLADLVGAHVPPTARGRSLVPLLRGEPIEPAAIVSATGMRRNGMISSVVVDGHKLIRDAEGETLGVFDLENDPRELVNLKDDRELRGRLLSALPPHDAVAEAGSARPMELDPATKKGLEAMGYMVEP